ncbi:MAG: RHS repeat-associated protein [Paraglaciecola sp.]|jgi:RHS repeat-associated protein
MKVESKYKLGTIKNGKSFLGEVILEIEIHVDDEAATDFKEYADYEYSTIPNISYYILDHLGNTRVVYSNASCGEETYVLEYIADYYPYGKVLREFVCTSERFLTTEHERDTETGWDNRGARFYDSEVGRFLSLNPLAMDFAEWSPYNYTLGNPINLVDIDGRAPSPPPIGFSQITYTVHQDYSHTVSFRKETSTTKGKYVTLFIGVKFESKIFSIVFF